MIKQGYDEPLITIMEKIVGTPCAIYYNYHIYLPLKIEMRHDIAQIKESGSSYFYHSPSPP